MAHELMHLRIGSWILHADALILPVAGLSFAVLAHRALRPAFANTASHALFIVLLLCVGGALGARVYGLFQPIYAGQPVLEDGAWRALRFGSMGGIYGVFFAGLIVGRARTLELWDAIVPAIALSAAVARSACVFQGCCVGCFSTPINVWPFLDIAALLIAVHLSNAARIQWKLEGVQAVSFLAMYGVLRFAAEHSRDTFFATGDLTWGQLLSIAQILIAIGLAAFLRIRASMGALTAR